MVDHGLCPGCGLSIHTHYPYSLTWQRGEKLFCTASCAAFWVRQQRQMEEAAKAVVTP